jgi:outer membrane lipoprotein SlyB
MKRLFLTTLILSIFTLAFVGCVNSETTSGGNADAADQIKELDGLMDSVRTDQYADNSLDPLQ